MCNIIVSLNSCRNEGPVVVLFLTWWVEDSGAERACLGPLQSCVALLLTDVAMLVFNRFF